MTQGTDLKLAARRLIATPLFTLFAVLSLAVGVAVTTAMYSVVDGTFWREPGVREPDTVAAIMSPTGGGFASVRMSRRDYDAVRQSQTSFEVMAASAQLYPAVASPAATDLMIAEAVSGSYFQTLGVEAALGRVILPSDEHARVVTTCGGRSFAPTRPSSGRACGSPVNPSKSSASCPTTKVPRAGSRARGCGTPLGTHDLISSPPA